MATSTEPIIVQIINETGQAIKGATGGGSSSSAGSKSGSGGVSAVIGGLSKLTLLGTAILTSAEIISNAVSGIIKPIKTILTGIFKLVAQFLRPVADIIIILLQPILMLIKPFVKLFSTLMQPFRKLAFSVMKTAGQQEGGILGIKGMSLILNALGIMLEGVMASLMPVLGSLFSTFVISPIFNILEALLPSFKPLLEKARLGINEEINKQTMGVYDETLKSMTTLANSLNTQFGSAMTSGMSNAKDRGVAAVNAFWEEMGRAAASKGKYKTTGAAAQAYVTSSTFDQAASDQVQAALGNLTGMDAWNRLVKSYNSGGN